jgi:hypothetical protein
MTGCPLAHSDAAYVLGALSPTERLEYEKHLPDCEPCRASVAQLAGLPGLLGRVPVEQVESPLPFEPLPESVLPDLVAAVRREQRRKAVLATLGAAAAVAILALGIGAIGAVRDHGQAPEAAPTSSTTTSGPLRPMDVVVDWGVRADVSLTEGTWGTHVDIQCRYATSDDEYAGSHAYRYNLVVFTKDGGSERVASWQAKPGQTYVGSGDTATKLGRITRVELQSAHGDTILRLAV